MFQKPEMIRSALHKLFGPHSQIYSAQNLPALSLVKKIYRRKSMEYHPDRAHIMGVDENTCTEEFKKLNDAYRLLLPFIQRFKPRFYYSPRNTPRQQTTNWANYTGTPKYRTRFCQFLRRKNLIDFKTVVDALCWQMNHRPRVGDIAQEHRFLSHKQLLVIFEKRQLGEKTLDAGVRLNLLDVSAQQKILSEQKKYHFPIGRYFIEKHIFTEKQLFALLLEFEKLQQPEHN
ncbi:MAG: J domain-containing protein [Spirochaetales bacterium]|nr:J domain-containing protein [Spirochaetales bacterium]